MEQDPHDVPASPDRYSGLAAYYDAAYAQLRDDADVEFYTRLAEVAQGPVLELGVGTGRVLLEIAERGIPVTGLDLSAAMLRTLRGKSALPTLRLVQAPMQRFALGDDRFCLIYAAFRGFQHLGSVADQLSCLACVRRHLAPGGTFAFDVFAPRLDRLAAAESPEVEEVRFPLGDETVVRYARTRVSHADQRLEVTFRHERRRGTQVVASEETELSLRYFFRFELEHLMARAGFEDVRLYGGFDRRPYDYVSGETVVVAKVR